MKKLETIDTQILKTRMQNREVKIQILKTKNKQPKQTTPPTFNPTSWDGISFSKLRKNKGGGRKNSFSH